MAGKTKRSGNRTTTPRAADLPGKGQLGHMGLKSSPYAPVDCKLVNQYMILDRMQAHYKKLNKTKAAVDTSAPKAWLVSQKMRDAARREAVSGSPRKSPYSARGPHRSSRPMSPAGSEHDRDEMYAMMESLSHLDGGDLDELDGPAQRRPQHRANTSMELHRSDSSGLQRSDMHFVNRMVNDSAQSPSKYHTGRVYSSNIPTQASPAPRRSAEGTRVVAQKPLYKTQLLETYQASPAAMGYTRAGKPLTPRSGDVLEQNAGKFTEEKPFQPRTLKSNRKSKLSEFKYYTAPKRKGIAEEEDGGYTDEGLSTAKGSSRGLGRESSTPTASQHGGGGAPSMRNSLRASRPGTANTLNSTDWMNETIISRDHTERDTPSGVPALDISLDQDHLKWIKEQQSKAQLRLSAKSPHTDLGSTRGSELADTRGMNGTLGRSSQLGTLTLNGTDSGVYGGLDTARQLRDEEEELKYLQFIQDVTNDVLDRGIFTNRVLRVVFESHVERRKHELKISKMRSMLEDLRVDLGIPANDDEDSAEGLGLTATWRPHYSPRDPSALKSPRADPSPRSDPRANRRSRHDQGLNSTLRPANLPNLQHTAPPAPKRGRTPSPEGKPPLPRPNSRGGSRGAQSPSPSRSQDRTPSREGSSVFDTVTDEPQTADILTIDHEDSAPADTTAVDDTAVDDFMNGNGSSDMLSSTIKASEGGGSVAESEDEDVGELYERQLANTLDEDDHGSLTGSEDERRSTHAPASPGHDTLGRHTPDRHTPDRHTPDRRTPVHSDRTYSDDDSVDENIKNYQSQAGEIISNASEAHEEITETESPPKPTPRRRKGSETRDTARSYGNTTTDTIDVSELDEDDYDEDDSF